MNRDGLSIVNALGYSTSNDGTIGDLITSWCREIVEVSRDTPENSLLALWLSLVIKILLQQKRILSLCSQDVSKLVELFSVIFKFHTFCFEYLFERWIAVGIAKETINWWRNRNFFILYLATKSKTFYLKKLKIFKINPY